MIFTATDKAMSVTCPDFELEVFENTYALPEPLTKHSLYQWITFIQEVGATRKRDFYIHCCNITPFLKKHHDAVVFGSHLYERYSICSMCPTCESSMSMDPFATGSVTLFIALHQF